MNDSGKLERSFDLWGAIKQLDRAVFAIKVQVRSRLSVFRADLVPSGKALISLQNSLLIGEK